MALVRVPYLRALHVSILFHAYCTIIAFYHCHYHHLVYLFQISPPASLHDSLYTCILPFFSFLSPCLLITLENGWRRVPYCVRYQFEEHPESTFVAIYGSDRQC